MFLTCHSLRRLMALLLPAIFPWVCAVCVSICGREAAEAADHSAPAASAEVDVERGAPECEGCPFASFPN